jgi:DNA-binding MarR family transcriptional regulator
MSESLGNILPMSSDRRRTMGLPDAEAAALGEGGATRVRTFRLILLVSQTLRTMMDDLLRADGLTTQQAALLSVCEALDGPTLSGASGALGTTRQNVKQVARALERKGFLCVELDAEDARMRRLIVTEKSRAYWRGRSADDQRAVVGWFSALPDHEAATLFELLSKLEAGLRTS